LTWHILNRTKKYLVNAELGLNDIQRELPERRVASRSNVIFPRFGTAQLICNRASITSLQLRQV